MNMSPARVWNKQSAVHPKTSIIQILIQPRWGGTEQGCTQRAVGWWIDYVDPPHRSLPFNPVWTSPRWGGPDVQFLLGRIFTFYIEFWVSNISSFCLFVSQFLSFEEFFPKRNNDPHILIIALAASLYAEQCRSHSMTGCELYKESKNKIETTDQMIQPPLIPSTVIGALWCSGIL